MKIRFSIIIITLFMMACSEDEEATSPINQSTGIPTIQANAIYDITITDGIVYAEGLSHESLNSNASSTFPLLLDAYVPNNDIENRPAILFIHGGGFVGGSRKGNNMDVMAKYFAERGWVTFSIDYRLKNDRGTIPQEWVAYGENNIAPSQVDQFSAIYPAIRDAKAALRWIFANADTYNINTDFVSVGGGSAGAIIATTLGVTEPEDYTNELSSNQDPTLSTTNINQQPKVRAVLDFWGSNVGIEIVSEIYGKQRFDATDAPIMIVHGTNDSTVEFFNAENLVDAYTKTGVDYTFYPLEGAGHGPWNATVNGKRLEELAFDFVVEQLELGVQ